MFTVCQRFAALSLAALVVLSGCAPSQLASWTIQAPRTEVTTANGDLRINGQPFFPFGFYHISWADQGTAAQRLRDVKIIAEAGFNTMLTEPIRSTEQEMPTLLRAAQREKLLIVAHGIGLGSVRGLMEQPSLLGFTLMDDSNYNSTPAAVAELQTAYKAAAPHKLTSLTLALAMDRPESGFFGVSDVVSNMSYPIGGTDEIGVVYSVMRRTVEQAAQRGVVPVASLQTFAWPKQRWPTPAELRNMTYQALMAGVKGVVYYSYRSGGNQITDHPELWSAAQAMALQVRQLSPSLLSGVRREFTPAGESPTIRAVQYSGAGVTYLMVLNSSAQAQPVKLALPGAGRLRPLFSSSTLKMQAGTLSGTLGALGVQVFAVE
jgi:hypothetical protein